MRKVFSGNLALQGVKLANDEPEIVKKIPEWAVAVIVVLNSVIIIFILLLVLGVVWKRYSRQVAIIMSLFFNLAMRLQYPVSTTEYRGPRLISCYGVGAAG